MPGGEAPTPPGAGGALGDGVPAPGDTDPDGLGDPEGEADGEPDGDPESDGDGDPDDDGVPGTETVGLVLGVELVVVCTAGAVETGNGSTGLPFSAAVS